jgi:hypothetical protein
MVEETFACLKAAQSYLEAAFPGQIEATSETEITISHDDVRHQIVLQPEFLKQCSNDAYALHERELADCIRESRPSGRRFLVVWHEGRTRTFRVRVRVTGVTMAAKVKGHGLTFSPIT